MARSGGAATDFPGNYTAGGVGVAVVGGGSVVTLRNPHGVTIQAHWKSVGLRFKVGASGVTVTMK